MTKVIFEVDKLQETDLIGRLVTSNAGRDTGKSYIVIGLVDDDLLVANGATKTIEMPKKKKNKTCSAYWDIGWWVKIMYNIKG